MNNKDCTTKYVVILNRSGTDMIFKCVCVKMGLIEKKYIRYNNPHRIFFFVQPKNLN